MGMGDKSIKYYYSFCYSCLLWGIVKKLLKFASVWAFSVGFVYAEANLDRAKLRLTTSLEAIGFDRVSIDRCIVEAGRAAPENSGITKFVFNVNLAYLDFTTFEVIEASAGGEAVFSGRVRFSAAFQQEEQKRMEFYRHVRETYGINYLSDVPAPVNDSDTQLIQADLKAAELEDSTFYKIYVGEMSQTVPYVNDFSFTFFDRTIVETVIEEMEALSIVLGCQGK